MCLPFKNKCIERLGGGGGFHKVHEDGNRPSWDYAQEGNWGKSLGVKGISVDKFHTFS